MLPRVLAGVGSGVGALVVFGGAVWSAVRFAAAAHARAPGTLAGGNALIALGTLVLSSGGLLQGIVGQDEAFAISLAVGIVGDLRGLRRRVVGAEPRVADAAPTDDDSSRRTSLPANVRGSASTTSTRVGSL